MRSMKRLFALLLALMMVLSACKQVPETTQPGTTVPTTEQTEPTTAPGTTKAPETTKKEEETQSPQSGGDHEHVYRSQILVYPGCESEGEMAMVCLYCGDAKDREVIEATGHTYNSVLVDIDSPVYHTANVGVCSVCKEVLGFEEYVDEHTFVSKELVPCVDTAGGYTDYGYEIFVCSDPNCGYTLYVGANAADGHYYVADEGSGKLYCRCGKRAPDDVKMINDNPNAGQQIFAAD